MGEIAADRTAIANGGMSHVGDGLGQQRRMVGDLARGQEVGMPRQRADLHNAAFDGYPAESCNPRDVDQEVERHQPQIERRKQALSAREQLRALAIAGKQRHRLLDACGTRVIESRSFHYGVSSSTAIYAAVFLTT